MPIYINNYYGVQTLVKGGYRKLQSNVKDCQDFSTKPFHQSLGDHNRAAHKKREDEDMDDKKKNRRSRRML